MIKKAADMTEAELCLALARIEEPAVDWIITDDGRVISDHEEPDSFTLDDATVMPIFRREIDSYLDARFRLYNTEYGWQDSLGFAHRNLVDVLKSGPVAITRAIVDTREPGRVKL